MGTDVCVICDCGAYSAILMELLIQNREKQEMFKKNTNPKNQQKPSKNKKRSVEGFEKHLGGGGEGGTSKHWKLSNKIISTYGTRAT